jgi:5'-deoxynucleotidase YfbR-like HD superfamily hydrolase
MDHGAVLRSKSRYAGMVKRYHAWPTIQTQTVADHTFHVIRIHNKLFGAPSSSLLYHMIYHDLGELTAGDTPFPAKRVVEGLREPMERAEEWGLKQQGVKLPALTAEEHIQFKIADLLEMWEFAVVEAQMGNVLANPIRLNILHYLREMYKSPEHEKAIGDYIEEFESNGTHESHPRRR